MIPDPPQGGGSAPIPEKVLVQNAPEGAPPSQPPNPTVKKYRYKPDEGQEYKYTHVPERSTPKLEIALKLDNAESVLKFRRANPGSEATAKRVGGVFGGRVRLVDGWLTVARCGHMVG